MPGVLSRKTRTPRGKLGKLSSSTPTATATTLTKTSKLQSAGKAIPPTGAPFSTRSSNIEIVLPSRKRKADGDESTSKKLRREPEAQPVAPAPAPALDTVPATPTSRKRKSVRFVEPEPAPSTPSRKRRLESDDTDQAEALLERLNLQSPISKRSKTTVHRRAPQNDFDLPKELLDLLDLHAAFLKTLSMQFAHSGTTAPIDLRTLYSSVTRAWGKRHVTLDDIQRCLGVLSWTPVAGKPNAPPAAPFFLCDYGRDKICIELRPSAERGPLREPKLNMDFEANLRTLWLTSSRDQPPTVFLGTLPKAAIQPSPTKGAAHPLLASKQTTLDAFKRDIALKRQQAEETKAAAATAATAGAAAAAPPLSLLDRIRLKESALAALPQGPSDAELQRRSALQRAADVAAVIGMLCKATAAAGQARVSFTMAALLVRVRDSLRTPVSAEDGMLCVRLLAGEVGPAGWLRVVKVGGRENVVVQSGLQPSVGVVEERVRVLLG